MLDAAQSALSQLIQVSMLISLISGVLVGLVVGILPGLGGTAGLALLLPFVFGMDPSSALAMMIGMAAVTTTSDTFPSVLMGIPGTSGSQATVMDGFPMAKKGEGTRALSAAFASSLFGGLFGALILSFAILAARPIILSIGFGEQFMLVVLALSMVGILTGLNLWKGLASCALGLALGALGAAPMSGVERASFGTSYLLDPLSLTIVGLAMFATPEIVELLRRGERISENETLGAGWLQGPKDWLKNWWLSLRCAAIGSLLGALPGLGGSVVDWIAYGHAIQTTKDRDRYGTGDVRGVIAPESSNNAKEGGALIPTLLLGIPGSGTMAILLGGLLIVGIDPGVSMVTHNLDQVYVIIWALALANVAGTVICFGLAPQIARLTTIRYALLAPFMLGIISFAAFQSTRNWGDLIALFVLSVLGVYMKRFGWSRPALLIGFVLSVRVETSVYQTVSLYGITFLQRPIVLILLALTIISIAAAFFLKAAPSGEIGENTVYSSRRTAPQWIMIAAIAAFGIYVMWDVIGYNQLTALFPIVVGCTIFACLLPLVISMAVSRNAGTMFYDEEHGRHSQDGPTRSAEYWLGIILGHLLLCALAGFVLGTAFFIAGFLILYGKARLWQATLGAVAFVLLLGGLSDQLTLRYPEGLLQTQAGVELPWPLQ